MIKPLLLNLILFIFIWIQPLAFSQTKDTSWSGKYRQITGAHNLDIDQFSSDGIEVEIARVHNPTHTNSSQFLAFIHGDTAVFKEEPDCRVELKRTKKGIIISDFCGGPGDDTGLYTKTLPPTKK